VFGREGAIIDQSLMLEHAGIKGNVIILAPATKGVQEKDGVLVTQLHKLLTGVLEEEDVSVVERVANLEAVDGISTACGDLLNDFSGGESVFVHAIVESDTSEESSACTGDQVVALGEDGLSLGVLHRESSEGTCADLFLSVIEESWVVDNSEDLITSDNTGSKGNLWFACEGSLLFISDMLGNWY